MKSALVVQANVVVNTILTSKVPFFKKNLVKNQNVFLVENLRKCIKLIKHEMWYGVIFHFK
jgi:hypothetical protein